MMNRRAVSPVLGIVLLLGLTTVAALSMFLITGTMLGGTQSSAEVRQAEQSFSEFAKSADRIASGQVDEASYELQGSQDPSVDVDGDAGFYEVRIDRENGSEVLTNGSLGAYRYTNGDGTTLAYQGGGVWRQNVDGAAQMVRSPEFHYRSEPDPTLTLPVVRFEDSDDAVAPTEGRVEIVEERDVYPTKPNHENPLHEGVVYLTVESEYCTGWEQFFESRTDGAVVERCGETGETTEDGLVVQLSVPFHFDGLGGDTVVAERITGAGDVYGSTREGPHTMESVSGVVEQKVEDCEDGGENISQTMRGGGLYCAPSGLPRVDYTIEPEGGDVEIAVDGRFEPNNFDIVGDGTVTVFVEGPALPMPGDVIGNASDPEQLRIMVHSDYDVGGIPGRGGGPRGAGHMDVHGLLYAPNSIVDFAGNGDLYGGVVAYRVDLQSGAASVSPDPDVLNTELEFDRGGEPFYYLHVTETTLRVQD